MPLSNLKPRRREIGPFDCIEFESAPGAPTVVFFHGYGANGADLAPLAAELQVKTPYRWVFPDAPHALDWGGLAWFEIDVASIEHAQRTGRPVDWSGVVPPGLAPVREKAEEFLKALGTPMKDLVLGGFSQGSMLALDLALRAKEKARGVAVLSGNLIDEKEWGRLALAKKGLKFFQSHGIADPILGHSGAVRLEKLLRDAGLDGKLLSFEGGHTIPLDAADALAKWLDARE